MYDTFKRFADEILFAAHYVDPYVQSHPMPADRVAALEVLARTPYWDKKDPPELQFRHDMMRAKLYGFIERPEAVLRRYPPSDTSLPARYARAISTYRHADLRAAMAQIDGLIQAKPQNPYFYELKGQALLEGGHPAEAIAPLRHAVQLAPNAALIQILLAQALIATNDTKGSAEAIALLRSALAREPESPDAYASSPWHTAARAISPRPILLPRNRPSRAATTRRRASLPRAPRSVFRSARPAG